MQWPPNIFDKITPMIHTIRCVAANSTFLCCRLAVSLRLRSVQNSDVDWSCGPKGFGGTKKSVFEQRCIWSFLFVAISAVAPVITALFWMLMMVRGCLPPSHPTTDDDPLTMESLSGCLVFRDACAVYGRPGGSMIDGIHAFERERCIMTSMALGRAIRQKPRKQDKPRLPLKSIRAPQVHIMCGSLIIAASRRPCCPVSAHALLSIRHRPNNMPVTGVWR